MKNVRHHCYNKSLRIRLQSRFYTVWIDKSAAVKVKKISKLR